MGEVQVTRRERRGGYRSLFWPIILISIGVVWLLANMGVLDVQNVVVLARIWPLILIVVGLDILFGRTSPVLGALIGIGSVVLIIALMLVGPSIGLGYDIETVQMSDSEPLGDTTSAAVVLSSSTNKIVVNGLSDSNDLISFDLHSWGEVDYTVEGDTQKTVTLSQPEQSINGFAAMVVAIFSSVREEYTWNVALNPKTPLDLRVNNATGSVNLDLSTLNLTGLNINLATGGLDLRLPVNDERYDGSINLSTGNGNVVIPDGANVDLRIDASTGNFRIDVPENTPMRVEAHTSTGGISAASFLQRLSGDDEGLGDKGVWESAGYDPAEPHIRIVYNGATGGLTVD